LRDVRDGQTIVGRPFLYIISGLLFSHSLPLAMHVESSQGLLIIVVFLRNWWIRRRTLNSTWQRGGISRLDFIRLVATVLSVIFLYLPLSLYVLAVNLSIPLHPFSWSRIHGPSWGIILIVPSPTGKAEWEAWIGPVLAITSFFFVGFTRPAKHFYQRCIEWFYDHLPSSLQARFPALRRISEKCKEQRSLTPVLDAPAHVRMVNKYMTPPIMLTLDHERMQRIGSIAMTKPLTKTRYTPARRLCKTKTRMKACRVYRISSVRSVLREQNLKFQREALCRLHGLGGLVLQGKSSWRQVRHRIPLDFVQRLLYLGWHPHGSLIQIYF
jgi:Pheromone A receptor